MRSLLAAVILLTGCATGPSLEQLKRRAAFDLNCDEPKLEVVEIDNRTRGVRGCNQRATYVESCKPCANGYVGCECTWMLNTDGMRHEGPATKELPPPGSEAVPMLPPPSARPPQDR